MKAIELSGFEGFQSLRMVEVEKPKPGESEVLIAVKAAGINFAELELARGRYPATKQPPFIMGFEASGVVAETGPQVKNLKVGDKVAAIVSSGGYAEYATADAAAAIPIPPGISFGEATTIPVHGLTAFALLQLAAKPQPVETLLIQAAAGGVGIYLVQLAKIMGVKKVIALVGSRDKISLVASLGADVAINYRDRDWPRQVREATGGSGVDVVLEAASGEIGDESFKLLAPFGRMVVYGARNIHDTYAPERVRQLIYKNQSITGFNFPTLPPQRIAECVRPLLALVAQGKLKLFASHSYPLADVASAFEALASRTTIGKVVLTP